MLLKNLFLPTLLSLATTTTAQEDDCPKHWYSNTFDGITRCCYGHMQVEMTTEANHIFCCMYDLTPPEVTTTTFDGTPTTTATDWTFHSEITSDTCLAKIPFTASDYSSQVSSASSSIVADARATKSGPSSNSASPTATNSGSSSGKSSSTGTSLGSGTSTTNAAVPAATAGGIVLGAAAVALAVL